MVVVNYANHVDLHLKGNDREWDYLWTGGPSVHLKLEKDNKLTITPGIFSPTVAFKPNDKILAYFKKSNNDQSASQRENAYKAPIPALPGLNEPRALDRTPSTPVSPQNPLPPAVNPVSPPIYVPVAPNTANQVDPNFSKEPSYTSPYPPSVPNAITSTNDYPPPLLTPQYEIPSVNTGPTPCSCTCPFSSWSGTAFKVLRNKVE
ncbi:hypothetical protein HMI55_003507 [Coelomomyces lativittatus]|nr:hypothetical protein HMI55_003507 [Coelomomyces lativittatus]